MAFCGFLKQSTAATIKLGPFVDDTDGNTAETSLTISQADVRLSKNGGNYAQKNESSAATHDELGEYDCALNTTDTNTVGRLRVTVHEAGALIVIQDYYVLEEAVFDLLFGANATGIPTGLLDQTDGIESGLTPRQALRVILASAAGELSGAATSTVTVENPAGTATRITATVDEDGNRTAVTLNAGS